MLTEWHSIMNPDQGFIKRPPVTLYILDCTVSWILCYDLSEKVSPSDLKSMSLCTRWLHSLTSTMTGFTACLTRSTFSGVLAHLAWLVNLLLRLNLGSYSPIRKCCDEMRPLCPTLKLTLTDSRQTQTQDSQIFLKICLNNEYTVFNWPQLQGY